MALRVLVVDDSSSMRAVVRKTLKAAGFAVEQCLEAPDGLTALELLRRQAMDVVLSDLHMPGMNGMDLLRALKQEGLVPRCFILVTTEGRKERLKEALSLGARGFVKKPFHPEGLRKILSLFVGEPDAALLDQDNEGMDF
jgi:two-component system, chemotaxis family, chemotaxis protein CheY